MSVALTLFVPYLFCLLLCVASGAVAMVGWPSQTFRAFSRGSSWILQRCPWTGIWRDCGECISGSQTWHWFCRLMCRGCCTFFLCMQLIAWEGMGPLEVGSLFIVNTCATLPVAHVQWVLQHSGLSSVGIACSHGLLRRLALKLGHFRCLRKDASCYSWGQLAASGCD
jgi:hypothetical protein